jgi:hypothetical protein
LKRPACEAWGIERDIAAQIRRNMFLERDLHLRPVKVLELLEKFI